MLNSCGNGVQKFWMNRGKTCDDSSTETTKQPFVSPMSRVQLPVIHQIVPVLSATLSTANFRFSPLFEYIFYPQSTPPITNTTK